ncbi:hypothetical protein N657DRAFT_580017 [Parathielavia appendiculata]|uniref:Uncharacterized protein n=1 Tax=Parathielavia appendiculata TaxID=2587402 RepID=A0AAN6TU69_9PEZI|nr:hypothetical protein N657DRAFT_580017 [Parathielavia appendiculata]
MSTITYVLEGLTEPNATENAVAEAVHTFNERAKSAPFSIGDFLWEAFNAVFDVAGCTPGERQGRLLEFLGQLQQTTAADAEGRPLRYEGGFVWEDMPSFGWVARDRWNFDICDPSAIPQDRSKWENWAALLAKLTSLARSDNPQHPFDFSLFGLWTMRTAFEGAPLETAALASAVKHADIWVRYSGERLRRLCRDGRTFQGNSGVAGSKYADRGWRGFSKERWTAWRDELRAARDRHGDDAVIQDACG